MDSAATPGRGWIPVGRAAALARRVPLVLAILLALGIGLRVALSLSLTPAGMTAYDTPVYVGMAGDELFEDPARTAGYSMLLRAVHVVSADLDFTIAFQHLLGLATALLFWGAFRRLGTPVWVAAAGAGGVLLSLDQIFLEHSILTEGPFAFFLGLALYAGVRSLDEPRALWRAFDTRHGWVALAGIALGLAGWIRPVVVPVAPVFALWFAYAIGGGLPARLSRALLAGGAAAVMLVAYAGWQAAHNGFFGLTPSTGWAFYARTAQFADCTRFEPPPGTRALCERTPSIQRPGPDFYAWEPGSPARQLFGGQPHGNDELTTFARRAIVNQPWDYLKTVAIDSLRYFYPPLDSRPFGGVGYAVTDIDRRSPGVEDEINEALNNYYEDESFRARGFTAPLADLQEVLRLQPWTMIGVALLSAVALALSRGRLRAGLVLMLGTSAMLLLVPTATAIWNARYAVPVTGPLVGSAAVGAWLLIRRLRGEGAQG